MANTQAPPIRLASRMDQLARLVERARRQDRLAAY